VKQCVEENPELLNSWSHKVSDAFKAKEGCRIQGKVQVNRVSGQIYFSVGHSVEMVQGSLVHKFPGMSDMKRNDVIFKSNYNHTFHSLSFGEDSLEGQVNPMDGVTGVDTDDPDLKQGQKFTYFLKIVPSIMSKLDGGIKNSAQYSMTSYAGAWQRNSIPGVWLDYEISPMVVRYYEQQKSFSHFITNLCAIIGGVYAVAGVVDMMIYKSLKNYRRTQLGKD